jgi:DNA polymerase III alpha subunit
LHVKSHHSIGLGTASISALVQHAGRLGFSALALTDVETLRGQVQFHAACRALGLAPITGAELRVDYAARHFLGERRGRVVLLASDAAGYSNLCQIVTQRRTGPVRAAPPLESLRRPIAGLFVLTDDPSLLEPLATLAGRQWVRALVVRPRGPDTASEQALVSTARALDVPIAADVDAELLETSDVDVQRLARALHLRECVGAAGGAEETLPRRLPAPELAERLFDDLPNAVVETARIAEACSFDLLSWYREAAHGARGEMSIAAQRSSGAAARPSTP